MGIITFPFSLLGRHSNRSGDLHRQRDQECIEHILCQEQGEYTIYIAARKQVMTMPEILHHIVLKFINLSLI